MDSVELNLNIECRDDGGGSGEGGGSTSKLAGDGLIDRSKVRILLCDNNANSSEEVLTLLMRCSYQVTSVRSARQVIDALNAEGPDIDLILAEVDIPMSKGMKMLKYITRHKDLRRIPVIMMSAQDEVSTVVKCLRLGAADYLVKPLRTNELLNLWTHMWRRRRMLGLVEKNILCYEFDVVASDPSDANTTSTTLFSDDTDERSRRTAAVNNPEIGLSAQQEEESAFQSAVASAFKQAPNCRPDVPGICDRRTGQFCAGPKKSELRIGESSAFFTYVKSSIARNNSLPTSHNESIMSNSSLPPSHNESIMRNNTLPPSHNGSITRNNSLPPAPCRNAGIVRNNSLPASQSHNKSSVHQSPRILQNTQATTVEETAAFDTAVVPENGEAWEKSSQGDDFPSSSSLPDSMSLERSCTPPGPTDYLQQRNNFVGEKVQQQSQMPRISGLSPHNTFPYYMPGVMNHQVMMPPPAQMYQQHNLHDFQNHAAASASAMLPPQYNHLQHCAPHMGGMASFPYYPLGMCLPPNQVSTASAQPWPNSSVRETKTNTLDRREAALMKFRQKRKERCFDKKIRYVNRKKLAERRPRVRGQFVRKVNGVNVDLNGHPASADYDDDEDEAEDEEELASQGYSMEDDASAY